MLNLWANSLAKGVKNRDDIKAIIKVNKQVIFFIAQKSLANAAGDEEFHC
jgi:hypothetical protein